jgi:hypothetical protein
MVLCDELKDKYKYSSRKEGAQSCINYANVDGRTPHFQEASKGNAPIVAQLINARYRLQCQFLTKTGVTQLLLRPKLGTLLEKTHMFYLISKDPRTQYLLRIYRSYS